MTRIDRRADRETTDARLSGALRPALLTLLAAIGLAGAPAAADAAADAPVVSTAPGLATPYSAPPAAAVTDPDADPLEQYMWVARPIIIFADNDRDPALTHQLKEIRNMQSSLDERDVVVIVDTEPGPSRSETTALRRKFRPHGFNLLLIGKDGEIKRRSPQPVSGAQLVRQIDRLPIRLQETGRP